MEKVFIAVPTYENIYPDTMKCIWELGRHEGNAELMFDFVRGYSVDSARNRCVHKAKEAGADRILFVDNDVTFGPDFLGNLMEHDEDVVLGYYLHRGEDGRKGLTNLCKTGQHSYIEVKGGGLGFGLVRLSVFDRFLYPWFRFVEWGDGGVLSEDLYFSEQCANNGIKVYADPRCYCGHLFRETKGGLL